jgi:hypothetical protein
MNMTLTLYSNLIPAEKLCYNNRNKACRGNIDLLSNLNSNE